ncbi:MAG: thermonuclease family protein [Sphingobacteriia bacterium]|nr:thermonuclease family protein [Sphingobacteriia bacterium]NCC39894.1 thermonuclease family protein [Gammaproteobacteria bacterium]
MPAEYSIRHRRAAFHARRVSRTRGGGRPALSTLLIALAILSAWSIERWGPGLIPGHWSLGGSGQTCTLTRVRDGDSMRLLCAGEPVEVRLHCIDAPETGQSPWGEQSRAHLRRIATPRVELHALEIDRFGRTIGEVHGLGETRRSLNLEQVAAGQAAVYRHFCEDPRFFRAEREARAAGRGIWSSPGEHQTPWTYRQRH